VWECDKTMRLAVSSVAMVLKYYGVDRDPFGNPTTPETVNNYFKRDEICMGDKCASLGYSQGNIKWSAAGIYSSQSNKNFSSQKIVYIGPSDYNSESVKGQIEAEKPVILRVPSREHWVVATGIQNDTFLINDPAYNRTALDDPAYGNNALAARNYQKTASDFSSFEVTSLAPSQILVTDSEGRRTRFDPSTSSAVEEIPNSFYYFEDAYDDPTDENPPPPSGSGVYIVLILTPGQDEYKVELIGEAGEEYSFFVHASDTDANVDFNLFEGDISSGRAENEYFFNYISDPQDEIEFSQQIHIDILPFVQRNFIFRKSRLPIPVAILSSSTFDIENVVTYSLRFGRTGNEESFLKCVPLRLDVNKDKLKDLICLFSTQKSGFQMGDIEGTLSGETTLHASFKGADSVIVY